MPDRPGHADGFVADLRRQRRRPLFLPRPPRPRRPALRPFAIVRLIWTRRADEQQPVRRRAGRGDRPPRQGTCTGFLCHPQPRPLRCHRLAAGRPGGRRPLVERADHRLGRLRAAARGIPARRGRPGGSRGRGRKNGQRQLERRLLQLYIFCAFRACASFNTTWVATISYSAATGVATVVRAGHPAWPRAASSRWANALCRTTWFKRGVPGHGHRSEYVHVCARDAARPRPGGRDPVPSPDGRRRGVAAPAADRLAVVGTGCTRSPSPRPSPTATASRTSSRSPAPTTRRSTICSSSATNSAAGRRVDANSTGPTAGSTGRCRRRIRPRHRRRGGPGRGNVLAMQAGSAAASGATGDACPYFNFQGAFIAQSYVPSSTETFHDTFAAAGL